MRECAGAHARSFFLYFLLLRLPSRGGVTTVVGASSSSMRYADRASLGCPHNWREEYLFPGSTYRSRKKHAQVKESRGPGEGSFSSIHAVLLTVRPVPFILFYSIKLEVGSSHQRSARGELCAHQCRVVRTMHSSWVGRAHSTEIPQGTLSSPITHKVLLDSRSELAYLGSLLSGLSTVHTYGEYLPYHDT